MNYKQLNNNIMKTRIEAAKELNELFNDLEVRQNKVSTTYKKIFYDKNNNTWRLRGIAHDYTL